MSSIAKQKCFPRSRLGDNQASLHVMWAKYRILGDYPSCFLEEKIFLSVSWKNVLARPAFSCLVLAEGDGLGAVACELGSRECELQPRREAAGKLSMPILHRVLPTSKSRGSSRLNCADFLFLVR
jgi:hypothetical protein